jgi:membrane protease subunit HflC
MKNGLSGVVALVVLLLLIIVGYSSLFTVRQTEQALVVRLGAPVGAPITDPGLHFKAPFIDTVISIDNRILDLENPSQEIIASDQKRLVVDAFARYRIKDALRFYQSVGTISAANLQLTALLNAALRRVLGEVTFIQVVRDEREVLRTVRPCTSACRPSVSARPPNSAPRADRRRRRSNPRPTARQP